MADNILTDAQKRGINNMITKAFQEELDGSLSINLQYFKKQVNTILTQMKLIQENKKWVFFNHTRTKNSYALKGYILIFKFREFLLKESIDYRYYYFDNKSGYSKAVSFQENEIYKYVKFGKEAIQINPTALKQAQINDDYTTFVRHFFTLYTVPDTNEFMRLVSSKNYSGRIVRSNIYNRYIKSNPGLMNQKTGRYQMFTRGHIYEAIDDAASEVMSKDEVVNDDNIIHNYVFGKYLAYDNIKASQGGDNPLTNTSIKSESADLYDYSTIRNQLLIIQSILNAGLVNPQQAQDQIKELYLNRAKFESDEALEQSAQDALNTLLEAFQKDINKEKN